MCGICGFVKTNGKIEGGIIERMLAPMQNRGPDAEGIRYNNESSPFAAMGHRRLSVIDLETGDQPLSDESGRNLCIHNGEIYNFLELKEDLMRKGYKFRTKSDTEVIANMYHAHGSECVRHFNGMFAFAIWNKAERTLFLARDRAGIKPLYYYFDGINFVFSSSLKSFLTLDFVKKEIDPEALSEYLQYLYVNAPKSIFKSIRKLEPGSTLLLKNGKITIEKYWNVADIVKTKRENFINDEETCIAEIKHLLGDSVKKRLISDVPLGVFLSGGVDSSIITALAARSSANRIKTFSVTFKNSGYYDESKFARKVSELFGTEHSEIEIAPDLKNDLDKIIGFLDEPFADSSFVPTYYLSDFTRRHVKVALSGTGGDDIFAGYRRYGMDAAVNIFDKNPAFIKKGLSFIARSILPSRQNRLGEKAMLARRFFSVLNKKKEIRHSSVMSFIDRDMQKTLLKTETVNPDPLIALSKSFEGEGYVNQALYTDFMSYLSGDLLTKEDSATMAVSMEGRVPFLDHRLVEYSFSIEPDLKLKGFSTKYILKKAFEDILPRDILYREKHGFAFPISEHLRGDLSGIAREVLFSKGHNFFNRDSIENLLERHMSRKEDFGQHIWALMVFNLWYEKHAK